MIDNAASVDKLKCFVDDCESLARDIRAVTSDLGHEASGWKTYLAVDFSEIFAYIFPEKGAEGLRLFTHDHSAATVGRLLQAQSSHYLFAERHDPGLVLIEPYAIELLSCVDR